MTHPARHGGGNETAGSVRVTRILDHDSGEVVALVDRARAASASADTLDVLGHAHRIIADEVGAVYSIEERHPASRTLRLGVGSCSQRFAILESVARSLEVPTRVHARLVDRSFWYPRFPRVKAFLPRSIVLVWPEFLIGTEWRQASELFGRIGCQGGARFANSGSETLFEAAGRCAVDWDQQDTTHGLGRFVVADLGWFSDRDDAFDTVGQALGAPARWVMEPILSRVAASGA